jgi:hypothetical protein
MATTNKQKRSTKQPAHTLRCGHIKATIWQNTSANGPFSAATLSRPFKDDSGAWRNGTSFGLEALMTVVRQAQAWMASQAVKR